ncbi:MAG: hypothetical protein IPH13_19905 [Planctomycetes bacterium]|nr:hypothetical protein [Planctomycetota bacterium]MCC7169016.1 hypothetical protein [Planctomycetota bacterium]
MPAVWAALLMAVPATPPLLARSIHDNCYSYLELVIDRHRIVGKLAMMNEDVMRQTRKFDVDFESRSAFAGEDELLGAVVSNRITIAIDGEQVALNWHGAVGQPRPSPFPMCGISFDAALGDVLARDTSAHTLRLECRLFPYDPEHQTFASIGGDRIASPIMRIIPRGGGACEILLATLSPLEPSSRPPSIRATWVYSVTGVIGAACWAVWATVRRKRRRALERALSRIG